MPYIAQSDRDLYDNIIDELTNSLFTVDDQKTPGHLNYIITSLLLKVYGRNIRYYQHNEIIGMLECCKQEFYRRQTSPYEDICIKKNGDV